LAATTQDELEQVEAQPIDWNNRNQVVGDMKTIGAYTKFTFPGRKVA
jgi:alpha-amylase